MVKVVLLEFEGLRCAAGGAAAVATTWLTAAVENSA